MPAFQGFGMTPKRRAFSQLLHVAFVARAAHLGHIRRARAFAYMIRVLKRGGLVVWQIHLPAESLAMRVFRARSGLLESA